MFAFLVVAVSSLQVPLLRGRAGPDGDVRSLYTPDDMPSSFERSGRSAASVDIRVTVDPEGTTRACEIVASSRVSDVDKVACDVVRQRARFSPATWSDGAKVTGVIRTKIRFVNGYSAPADAESESLKSADLVLVLATMPWGVRPRTLTVPLTVGVDERGRITDCALYGSTQKDRLIEKFPQLVTTACQRASAELTLRPPVDIDAKAVRSVQTVSVVFSPE